MKKVLWLIVCLMTITMTFSSCYKKHEIEVKENAKESVFEDSVEAILMRHKNWASNSIAETQFTNEMVSFFRGATNKNFSSFYDEGVRFKEIINLSNYKNKDSVVVGFVTNRRVTTSYDGDKSTTIEVNFAVTSIMSKIDASKLDSDYEYYIDGRISEFIASPSTFPSDLICVGIINIDTIKIIDKKYISYKQI